MKTSIVATLAAAAGVATAFNGQVDYRGSTGSEGSNPQLHLRDYNTGSTYFSGAVYLTPLDQWRSV